MALLVVAPSARADDQEACIASYIAGQRLVRHSRLLEARRELLTCARAPCSVVLQRDCIAWSAALEERIPSVTVRVRTAPGDALAGARLLLDGVAMSDALQGHPVEVDPGEHELRLEAAARPPVAVRFVATERDRGRLVEIAVPPPALAAAPVRLQRSSIPWTAWAAGGIGVAAFASFATFGARGRAMETDELSSCRGHCSDAAINEVRDLYTIADVSLVVGLVASGLSAFFVLSRPYEPVPSP